MPHTFRWRYSGRPQSGCARDEFFHKLSDACRAGRRAWQALALTLALLCGSSAVAARAPVADAELIRAAWVYNFARFTTWPEARRGSEMMLCLAGEDPLAESLAQLRGRKLKGRAIVVQPLRAQDDPAVCHIVYLAATAQERLAQLTRLPAGAGVLSVSAQPGFAEAGGMVELTRVGDRTRFIVHLAAARHGGLEISPNLLGLAEVVGRPLP